MEQQSSSLVEALMNADQQNAVKNHRAASAAGLLAGGLFLILAALVAFFLLSV
jgi:hypothetical protein